MNDNRGHGCRALDELGAALPTSLAVLIVSSLLVAAAASAAIAGLHQSQREEHVRDAFAAARAGIATATYRLGAASPNRDECADVTPGAAATIGSPDPGLPGWCKAQSGDTTDGAGYMFRTSLGETADQGCTMTQSRRIVSVGRAGKVAQRVIADISTPIGSIFGRCAVIAWDRFAGGGTAREWVRGNVATNNEADLAGSLTVCGNVYANKVTEGGAGLVECGQKIEHPAGDTPFTPRKVPLKCNTGDAWSVPQSADGSTGCNQNARIEEVDPSNTTVINDPNKDAAIRSGTGASSLNTVKWNEPGHPRELELNSQATLTLTGNVYSFCKLVLDGNAKLYIAPRDPTKPVRIYIEDPDKPANNCPGMPHGPAPDTVLSINQGGGTAGIINLSSDPTQLQIFVIGTDEVERPYGTLVALRGNPAMTTQPVGQNPPRAWHNMVLYAPRSRVALDGNFRVLGAIAAKQIRMLKNSRLVWSRDVLKLNGSNFSVVPTYTITRFAQCTPPPDATPAHVTSDCSM